MNQIIFRHHLAPGDVVCMTAGIRDLHRNYPNKFITGIDTTAQQIWEHNPYAMEVDRSKIIKLPIKDEIDNAADNLTYKDVKEIWDLGKVPSVRLSYPLIHQSNEGTGHFIDGFVNQIERLLNIKITHRICRGDIYVSKEEQAWTSQIQEITDEDTYYWVVVNGGKHDYTCKWWDPQRMQKVVSYLKHITFVQVGEKEHFHHPLLGTNIINLVGKTDIRQLIRLIYHSSGVICPVTMAMHLAAAVPVRKEKTYGRITRPCVVIAGGREPTRWEAYTNHAYLHTCGTLPCCDNGGCWKSRVVPLGDNDEKDKSLCTFPELTENGIVIPKCMKMITVRNVVEAITQYLP